MIESGNFKWILTLVLVGTGLWFLLRGLRPAGTGPSATDRISDLAHTLMAVAMTAMIWSMG